MAKETKAHLKDRDDTKKVLNKSKNIKKKESRISKEKKKLQQTVANEMITGRTSTCIGGQNDKKHKDKQKNKEEWTPKDVTEKRHAKKEKKKANKLAKKLEKMEMDDQEDRELQNKEKGAENTEITGEIISKTKQRKKKTDDTDNKVSKVRYPFRKAETVFVGNLPVNTKRVQLLRLFRDYGPVNAIRFQTPSGKFLFKHKDRKKACTLNAWVVLKDAETAKRALDLNGTVFKNNHLRITTSELSKDSLNVKRTVFVGSLKLSANEEKLREIFSSCGDIDYIRCLYDDKGCKGVAYVCFKAAEAVGLALELNETVLDGRPINVERYSVKKLGAKKARESACKGTKILGGGKEMKNKKSKDTTKGNLIAKTYNSSKKSKYRGVKVDGTKKKPKKKIPTQMQTLAKKIAPKKS